MSRHARRRGPRHLKRPAPYQGWAPDEADQLAMAQAGNTPPLGFPAVQVQPRPMYPTPTRPPMQASTRWLLAGLACFASLFLGVFMILAVAFVLGAPEPATADTQPVRQPVTQTVIVAGDKLKIKARELCPTEDSCDIDYEGRGTWTITRVVP